MCSKITNNIKINDTTLKNGIYIAGNGRIVDEHVDSAVCLLEVVGELADASIVSYVELMKTRLKALFGQLLECFAAILLIASLY